MIPTGETDDVVEIFHTEDFPTAQKIVDVILRPEGIDAVLHDRKDLAFPGIGQPGGIYIAVPAAQRESAKALIDEAMENGFLEAP